MIGCRIAVLAMELFASVNSGLERIPARDVAIKESTMPTCSGRIPDKVQLISG